MNRAMQTAIHMLKNHPNLANLTFIVEPKIREILHALDNLHQDADVLMQRYADGQPGNCGCKFDFSRIRDMETPQTWSVDQLTKQDKKDEFYARVN